MLSNQATNKCAHGSCHPTSEDLSLRHTTHGRRDFALHKPLNASIGLSFAPLALTFIITTYIAWRRLFPRLSGRTPPSPLLKASKRPTIRVTQNVLSLRSWASFLFERAATIAFSTTIALSAVLAELIFCEISGILDPAARALALELTVTILLISLVIVMPALEIHSIITAAGWKLSGVNQSTVIIVCVLDAIGFAGWLSAFWWLGRAVLVHPEQKRTGPVRQSFNEGSLERIAVIGISLMASLAGFAAISSLWQTFGVRVRKVTETDITRKETGLQTTTELLQSKEARLRSLEAKLADTTTGQENLMGRIIGKLRGNAEVQELELLRMEVTGLETMQMSLANSARLLRTRREAQQYATTPFGRICLSASYVFSLYCLYRICATSIATIRRWRQPDASFATTDPINNVLALVAKHWDPSLDRAAWSRQISFLLSGLMLLASFNAVLQTVLLFSRFTPTKILQSAQQNLALVVSQISGTYVVSTALLLRSNLPKEMGSVIEGALGAPLDTAFVERWFEGWFLGACAVTALGIWVGRSIVGTADWEDDAADDLDVEMGKKS